MPKPKKVKIEPVYLKDRSALSLMRLLKRHIACSDARAFAEGKTLKEAWGKCVNPSWLCWYLCHATRNEPYSRHYGLAMLARGGAIDVYRRSHKRNGWKWLSQSKAECKAFRQYYKVR